jgi:hypothetical protein
MSYQNKAMHQRLIWNRQYYKERSDMLEERVKDLEQQIIEEREVTAHYKKLYLEGCYQESL